jgi:hypothetical protein
VTPTHSPSGVHTPACAPGNSNFARASSRTFWNDAEVRVGVGADVAALDGVALGLGGDVDELEQPAMSNPTAMRAPTTDAVRWSLIGCVLPR